MVEQSKGTAAKLTTQANNDLQNVIKCMKDSQSQITEHMDNTTEWSQCMTCELNRRSEDVQKFLNDELKKDIPTGYITRIIISSSSDP